MHKTIITYMHTYTYWLLDPNGPKCYILELHTKKPKASNLSLSLLSLSLSLSHTHTHTQTHTHHTHIF